MAVLSSREVLPRTYDNRIGSDPSAQRSFVCTTDGPTSSGELQQACGILQGQSHPEYAYLVALASTSTEPDYYHAELTYTYGLMPDAALFAANPLARPDVWSYAVSGATIPAETYYDDSSLGRTSGQCGGSTNPDGTVPLVNSAGDPLMGVTTQVGELKVTIKGNRATFNTSQAIAAAGAINQDAYLFAQPYQWQCQGISGSPKTEAVNGETIKFWEIQVSLIYRQAGFIAKLFDTGYNVIDPKTNRLQEATVLNKQGVYVPSSMPVALNEDGTQMMPSESGGGVCVRTIRRRLHPAVNFNSFFGTPQS